MFVKIRAFERECPGGRWLMISGAGSLALVPDHCAGTRSLSLGLLTALAFAHCSDITYFDHEIHMFVRIRALSLGTLTAVGSA